MTARIARWWKELAGSVLLFRTVLVAFALADRASYWQGADDASPVMEVLLLAALVLVAAFIRSIVAAIRCRGRFGWLPVWYLACFAVLAFRFMV